MRTYIVFILILSLSFAQEIVDLPSDDLTEITFFRDVATPYNSQTLTGSKTEKVNYTIRGYLKEIERKDSHLKIYGRYFSLENGTIEWSLISTSDDGGSKCQRLLYINSSGKEPLSKMNIYYALSGPSALEDYRLVIGYNENGFASGKPELSIGGDILVPVTVTESLEIHHSSPNIRTVCNGLKESTSFSRTDTETTSFPVTLLDFNIAVPYTQADFLAREPVKNEPEGIILSDYKNARFGLGIVHTSDVGIYGEDGPWNISMKIGIPLPYEERDPDRDGINNKDEESIGTDIQNPDTDGDGLLDGWEFLGVFKSGQKVVDLPLMGAHPLEKDLFVEIDWMQNSDHTHKPEQEVIQLVTNSFAERGIRLHFDLGQWGGGNSVPLQEGSEWHQFHLREDERADYESDNKYLFEIKRKNFDTNRIGIFYYGIFVHEKNDSSGEAEVGGNFYVALSNDTPIFSKAGTLMHEFGHTLQLGHGGRLDDKLQYDNTNYKANYISVMNYFFQMRGVLTTDGVGSWLHDLDYSDEVIPVLDESNLNENNGVVSLNKSVFSLYTCADIGHGANASDILRNRSANLIVFFQLNGSSVDWDCDGNFGGTVSTNINSDGRDVFDVTGDKEKLVGRSDWDKIVLKIGCASYGMSEIYNDYNLSVISELDNCKEHEDLFGSPEFLDEYMPPIFPYLGEACDNEDNDQDGLIDEGCSDRDKDGVVDTLDNCVNLYNPDQQDSDKDFVGDACKDEYIFKIKKIAPIRPDNPSLPEKESSDFISETPIDQEFPQGYDDIITELQLPQDDQSSELCLPVIAILILVFLQVRHNDQDCEA